MTKHQKKHSHLLILKSHKCHNNHQKFSNPFDHPYSNNFLDSPCMLALYTVNRKFEVKIGNYPADFINAL